MRETKVLKGLNSTRPSQ